MKIYYSNAVVDFKFEIRRLISFGTRSQPSTFPTLFQKKKKSALKKTRREDYVRKVYMKKKVLPPPPSSHRHYPHSFYANFVTNWI